MSALDAVVIGGTGGIGSAVVKKLAAAGKSVAFTYLRAERTALALQQFCAERGWGQVTPCAVDVRSERGINELAAACGPLDIVVFAAASGVNRELTRLTARHWDYTQAVNATGLFLVYKAMLPALAVRRGSLVALTSLGSRRVIPGYAAVGAAKAAMEAVVRYAAVEAAGFGVRINSICPGVVETKALDAFQGGDLGVVAATAKTPMGRLATPDEVADAVLWLAAPGGSLVTGQNVVVDAGWELLAPL